jgi:ABC-type Na+ transport system ATPase subunit NatA
MPLPPIVLQTVRQNLTAAESALKDLDEHISDAARAGVDVTEQRKTRDEYRRRVQQMRMVYGA